MNTPQIHVLPQDGVDQFEPQVNRVLEALLGHTRALVTDASDVGDFMPWPGREDPETLAPLVELMGRPVGMNERLWELGRELSTREDEAKASRH